MNAQIESEISHNEKEADFCTRKLASVQLIEDIDNHYHIDEVAIAKILGWNVVANRNELKKGEKVVFFEIDSLLPEMPWSEFMRDKKFRVKTRKIRGKVLGGLALPLSILGEGVNEDDYIVGQNLTQQLGVTKYENDADMPQEKQNSESVEEILHQLEEIEIKEDTQQANSTERLLGKNMRFEKSGKFKDFPCHLISKSDEPRIQSEPALLDIFRGKPYYSTLKYDGTSATYLINPIDKIFYIFSRNLWRDPNEGGVYKKIATKYRLKDKLEKLQGQYVIQGEIYGPGINENYLQVNDLEFVVFTIRDLETMKYLDMEELMQTCNDMELPMVEIVEKGDSFNYDMEELKNLSKGLYPGTENAREGIVFRLQKDWNEGYRCSFKIINDDYLVQKKDT